MDEHNRTTGLRNEEKKQGTVVDTGRISQQWTDNAYQLWEKKEKVNSYQIINREKTDKPEMKRYQTMRREEGNELTEVNG